MAANVSRQLASSTKSLAIVLLLVLCARVLPLPQQGRIANLPAFCPLLYATGLPCPLCGLTRSLVCCAHGQWDAAWHYHMLGPLLFTFLLLSSTRLLAETAAERLGFAAASQQFRLRRKGRVYVGWTVALLVVTAWTIRLAHWWPLPS